VYVYKFIPSFDCYTLGAGNFFCGERPSRPSFSKFFLESPSIRAQSNFDSLVYIYHSTVCPGHSSRKHQAAGRPSQHGQRAAAAAAVCRRLCCCARFVCVQQRGGGAL
jgi:hypothetical protein